MISPQAWRGAKPNKYRAQKTVVDGLCFDSKGESVRWCELKLREKAGDISDLERQVRYALDVNGVPICHYVADFRYRIGDRVIVEDFKGVATREYLLKKKLMKAIHNITVVET